jgi:hypothetical protein
MGVIPVPITFAIVAGDVTCSIIIDYEIVIFVIAEWIVEVAGQNTR